ncbi:potassium channel family protein [Proteinivorax tanatarense]
MKQFVVVGLGRFGNSVAKKLYNMGYEVLGLDRSEGRTQEAVEFTTHVIQVDATDEHALKSLGLRNFDVGIVGIGQDIQASILATLLLKDMGVPYVVAKAQNELHGKVLWKTGADRVVFPERDMGTRVANNLTTTNILDYIELAPDYSIAEITAPDFMVSKSLAKLDLRAKIGINVMAIKTGDNINVSPTADAIIKEGDILVVIGSNKSLNKVEDHKK